MLYFERSPRPAATPAAYHAQGLSSRPSRTRYTVVTQKKTSGVSGVVTTAPMAKRGMQANASAVAQASLGRPGKTRRVNRSRTREVRSERTIAGRCTAKAFRPKTAVDPATR